MSPSTNLIQALTFKRTQSGEAIVDAKMPPDFRRSGSTPWVSNGGPGRGHPARGFPFSFEAGYPLGGTETRAIHLLGVFAMFAGPEHESRGTVGASVQLMEGNSPRFRQELVNGIHYGGAEELGPIGRVNGDGTSIRTVGTVEWSGRRYRLDLLSLDTGPQEGLTGLTFRDLGSPAAFLILDAFLEHSPKGGCPFRSHGAVSLAEVGSFVRLGDRVRFDKSLDQLERALDRAEDLDEAKGQALTFIAVLTAAMVDRGATRAMHRAQLDLARSVDRIDDLGQLKREVRFRAEEMASPVFGESSSPSSKLMERALAIIDRSYAKDLTDGVLAEQLGLSTSHFRFLFRQATGHPFHKYLVGLRLEKARRLLQESEMPISDVARAVGFSGLSHFSRAFTQRFQISPTSVRRGAR